jgi:hypothetical protein
MRNEEKVNALAGIAATSAVVAMVLILLNLSVVMPLASSLASQVPPATPTSLDDLMGWIAQVRIQQPSAIDSVALLGIAAFLVISIASTAAVSKIARKTGPKSLSSSKVA